MSNTFYPDEALRGIPNEGFIGDDNYPTSELFYFKKRDNQPERVDGFLEESIYWRDDEAALTCLFDQKKEDGSIQFKAGAAVLSRIELDHLMNKPILKQQLSYERRVIPNNKYHGNLLLKINVTKPVMKKIAASIATLCISEIIRKPSS
jgi:hypothetical protein